MAKNSGGTRVSTKGSPRGLTSGSGLRSFLLSYQPASRMFTSEEEIDLVSKKLNLSGKSEAEMNEMRNNVVRIYRDAMDKEVQYDDDGNYVSRTEKYWDYSNAMQSVTAVIDYLKVRRGMEI